MASTLRSATRAAWAARSLSSVASPASRCWTCGKAAAASSPISRRQLSVSAWARSAASPVDPSASSTSTSSSVSPPSSAEDSPVFEPTRPHLDAGALPYTVERAGALADSLPVYTEYRNRRTSVTTIIRKVSGDLESLKEDLQLSLPSLVKDSNDHKIKVRDLRPYRPKAGRSKPDHSPVKVIPVAVAETGSEHGKIVLSGNRKKEIEEWLLERGF